jgi:hypothetical protein
LAVRKAVAQIDQLNVVRAPTEVLRVESFE